MMGIIGFSVGIVGFLLHQIIDIISEFKWELTSYYIQAIINTDHRKWCKNKAVQTIKGTAPRGLEET